MSGRPAAQINPEHHVDDPSATFWIQATPGTSYWRCVLPARALGAQAIALNANDVGQIESGFLGRQRGPAVWQFPGNFTRGRLMDAQRKQGLPVFVEVDDNYLVESKTQPGVPSAWKTRLPRPGEQDFASRRIHRRIIENACDGVIVSTPHLAEAYGKIHDNVHICPNSVDPADWPETPEKPDDGVFRIGYAFSQSHYWDWECILDCLEYAASQPKVEVVLIGLPPPFLKLNRFKYVNIPWADSLESYRENLTVLDAGLCPIKPCYWADARSDIKAMEYTMAGALSVCSPTKSYEYWTDGPCLMPLDNTAKSWTKIITWLLKNRDVVPEYVAEAKAYIMEQRTIYQGAEFWREAFASVGAMV